MKFTEAELQEYAAPLSDSEDQKCKNAINMVRDALKDQYTANEAVDSNRANIFPYIYELRDYLTNKRYRIFIQGSYANGTNVKKESDVDIAVVLENYSYADLSFKNEVEQKLRKHFVYGVKRGDKSIKIEGNTYRVNTDVVPCYKFIDTASNEGIKIVTDSGTEIINYPQQHISNGKNKNVLTNHYFKKIVRIAKKIKSIMEDYGYNSAKNIGSFGLESLIWNVPFDVFTKYSTLKYVFDEVVSYLYNNQSSFFCYKEVNNIKFLCLYDSNKYIQFITDLKRFYEYEV